VASFLSCTVSMGVVHHVPRSSMCTVSPLPRFLNARPSVRPVIVPPNPVPMSLVARRIAERVTFRSDRGFIYHLFGRPIYAALRQDDNRNRRHASAALIARKLMLLHYVLSQPRPEWYATEREKVELVANEFNVQIHALPYRVYDSQHSERRTRRYRVQKLPVFLSNPSRRVHFVCLVTEPDARDLRFFVREHSALLRELPAYTIVAVHAAHISNEAACRRAWEGATDGAQPLPRLLDRATLECRHPVLPRVRNARPRTARRAVCPMEVGWRADVETRSMHGCVTAILPTHASSWSTPSPSATNNSAACPAFA
jgi:hypothetical protein